MEGNSVSLGWGKAGLGIVNSVQGEEGKHWRTTKIDFGYVSGRLNDATVWFSHSSEEVAILL